MVTAYDAYNNVKTNYVGLVYFQSSDGAAVLPYTFGSRYTFVSGDSGVHTFSGFTLKTTPSQTITVTTGSVSKTSSAITVNPWALDHFTITGYPSSVTAGVNFGSNNVVVTAYDSYNNVKTDYVGQVYFTSTDSLAILPYTSSSKYTFTSGTSMDNGVHMFLGTDFTLRTAASETITVRDDSASKSVTSSSITVTHAAVVDHITASVFPTSVARALKCGPL